MDSNRTHNQLLGQLEDSRVRFVQAGKLLSQLKQNDNFRSAVGEGIDTWNAYLAQPEIGLSISEANRLIQIYEQFVQRYGYSEEEVADVPIKNLQTLLPIAKTAGDSDEDKIRGLFQDAAHLSQRDFKERLYESTTDSVVRTYEYLIMQRCIETGSLRKVHDFSSADVDSMIQRFKSDA